MNRKCGVSSIDVSYHFLPSADVSFKNGYTKALNLKIPHLRTAQSKKRQLCQHRPEHSAEEKNI